jgi:hypothetical protein
LNAHSATLSKTAEFSDVDFLVGEETFKGHRFILSRVPFFAAAMCSGCAEQGRGKIEIQEASADAFRFVLLAIDSGDFTFVEQQNDAELLRASVTLAHRFGMRRFKDKAASRLADIVANEMIAEAVASWFAFARLYEKCDIGARRGAALARCVLDEGGKGTFKFGHLGQARL